MPPPVSVSQIRLATVTDIDTIVQFNRAMASETEMKELSLDVVRSGVTAVVSDPALGRYFLSMDGAEINGQLMLTTEWSDWRNGQVWWIQSVYVRPDYRRRGVFRALYRHIEQLAGATVGVVGLRLYVEHNNRVAQSVYNELGMRDAGYVVLEKMWSQ
jgi:ribosomal protein S18 acetylase RimI-like enzyme